MKSLYEEKVLSFGLDNEIDPFFDDSSITDTYPDAVIIMGGVAAGKSTLRRQNYSHGYVLIDAPNIFLSLSRGEYLPFPGPIKDSMKLIGQCVANRAINERRNIVTEIIGGKEDEVSGLMAALKGIGYKVHLVFVNCTLEEALKSNELRGENNISAYYAEKFHRDWIIEACK